MLLLDLLEPVIHGIVLVVRYLRLIFGIVKLSEVVELLYELQIFISLLIFTLQSSE